MSKEYRKKLGEEWKATGKHPEYEKYYNEFHTDEIKEEEIIPCQKKKSKK